MDVMNFSVLKERDCIWRENNLTRTIEGQKLDQAQCQTTIRICLTTERGSQCLFAPVPGRRPHHLPFIANPVRSISIWSYRQTAGGLFGVAEKGGLFGIPAQDKDWVLTLVPLVTMVVTQVHPISSVPVLRTLVDSLV